MNAPSVMIRLVRSVKLKNGVLYPKEYPVNVSAVQGCPMICELEVKGFIQRVHYTRIFSGPSRNLVCAWIVKGFAKSVIGEVCQPGGYDRHGFPCWSKVYGMQ